MITEDPFDQSDEFENEGIDILDFTEDNPFGNFLMLETYYYHEILRKTIIGFGTLFNNIEIQHKDDNNGVVSTLKVPLNYGPAQKFLARITQQKDLNRPYAITLPRMSFEHNSIQYDPTRKSSITQTFRAADSGGNVKRYSCLFLIILVSNSIFCQS